MKPLAVYIHWPFCKSKCPYCDFNSHVREQVDQAAWEKALLTELKYVAEKTPGHEVVSIFFGGGTPSLMNPATAGKLIEAVHKHWPTSKNIEITLEANPTSVEAAALKNFRAAGVNRVSLGVQAFDAADLKFLGREHNVDEALAAVKLAAEIFPRFSFDLIYARPGQTVAAWKKELSEALNYARDHLSLYQLTIEENTAFYTAYKKHQFTLPNEDEAADLYEATQEIMEARGLPAYEISNHARPGEESRHNLAYWLGYTYVGIGPGAHGRIENEKSWIATQTIKSPERWLSAVDAQGHAAEIWREIPADEREEEWLMMRLRILQPITKIEWESRMIRPFPTQAIAKLAKEKMLIASEDTIQTTMKGRLVLTALTSELL